jgi:hypothetical protein
LIGSTIVSNKIILVIIAYFFTTEEYNFFNKAYYTGALLILFGTMGFHFAINQAGLKLTAVIAAVSLNVLISFAVIILFFEQVSGIDRIAGLFVYGIFSAICGIFIFQLLFKGFYIEYVKLTLTGAFLYLLIVPAVKLFQADVYLLLPLVSLIWFLICRPKFLKNELTGLQSLFKLYRNGIFVFIINSSIPLALVTDKFLINHYLEITTANAYTFAWGLTAPMFYIGNVVERFIYSSPGTDPKRILKKSIYAQTGLVTLYVTALLIFTFYFPSLLPGSVDNSLFKDIVLLMIPGYALYVIFHFPVNAYLFKFSDFKQKKIAGWYFAVTLIFISVLYIIFSEHIPFTYTNIIFTIWIYIFSLLIIKSLILFKEKNIKV